MGKTQQAIAQQNVAGDVINILPGSEQRRRPKPRIGRNTMNIGKVIGQVIKGNVTIEGDQSLHFGEESRRAEPGSSGEAVSFPETLAPGRPSRTANEATHRAQTRTGWARFRGFLINYDLKDSTGRQVELRGLLPDPLDAEKLMRDWLRQVLRAGAQQAGLAEALIDRVQDHGDGFCFPVERAEQTHRFAVAVHEQCRRLNLGREDRHAFQFRFGIARGEITWLEDGKAFAATNADLAARLRATAAPGGTLICPHTWGALSDTMQQEYETKQVHVPDEKRSSRTYLAHVWRLGGQSERMAPDPSGGSQRGPRKPGAKKPSAKRSIHVRARKVTFVEKIQAEVVRF